MGKKKEINPKENLSRIRSIERSLIVLIILWTNSNNYFHTDIVN